MKKALLLMAFSLVFIPSSWASHSKPVCKIQNHYSGRSFNFNHRYGHKCDYRCKKHRVHSRLRKYHYKRHPKHSHRYPFYNRRYQSKQKYGYYPHRKSHSSVSFGSYGKHDYFNISLGGFYH